MSALTFVLTDNLQPLVDGGCGQHKQDRINSSSMLGGDTALKAFVRLVCVLQEAGLSVSKKLNHAHTVALNILHVHMCAALNQQVLSQQGWRVTINWVRN